ncbi:hypothetical protein JCM10908_005626 [Rhodotorula pacifica]|uniref:uncharacterized protein n=1 Tax=Rhodotorula pacifica TaxID=1495444 RepID=UPI00316E7C82
MIFSTSRAKGFVPVVGEEKNVWPGVHVNDAATLYRLALESAPAGTILHAAAEEAVSFLAILEAIAHKLGVETRQLSQEELPAYGIFSLFLSAQAPFSSKKIGQLLGWQPKEIGLWDVKSDTYPADIKSEW